METDKGSFRKDLWIGIGMTILFHIISGLILSLLVVRLREAAMVLSILAELAYIVAVIRWAIRKGRRGIIAGMIIVYALFLLLVATCFGIVFLLMANWNR